MINIIQEKLKEIERKENIKILFACESGSRGWGFPSPDSDYDVRFIYTHPVNYYLSVQKRTDQFTFPITDELDINGWDISKTLQLITRSNTTPFEWIQSPVIYRVEEEIKDLLWNISCDYFCPKSSIHHYLGVARNSLGYLKEEKIKIKKLFYLLRSLLSALWNVEKREIAPMDIGPLLKLMPGELQDTIQELIILKAVKDESFQVHLSSSVKEWIDKTFEYCEETSGTFHKRINDPEPADELFRKIIRTYDYSGN